jgi:uncharacterized protein
MIYFAKDLQESYEFFIDDPVLMEFAGDILTHPEFIGMGEGEFYSHKYEIRLKHLMNVAYYTVKLARLLRCDVETTVRAALLHDFYPYQRQKKDTKYREHLRLHPHEALKNAEEYFELSDKEKDIIVHHMWPWVEGRAHCFEAVPVVLSDNWCAIMENFYHRAWLIPKRRARKVHQKAKNGAKKIRSKVRRQSKK